MDDQKILRLRLEEQRLRIVELEGEVSRLNAELRYNSERAECENTLFPAPVVKDLEKNA